MDSKAAPRLAAGPGRRAATGAGFSESDPQRRRGDAGGGTLTITTRPHSPNRSAALPAQVLVEFKDTGEGMNDEQRRRAFTSLLSTTKRTGTGLGLAIVRRIVEAHQGKLSLLSRPAKGTTIRLVLPNHPAAE